MFPITDAGSGHPPSKFDEELTLARKYTPLLAVPTLAITALTGILPAHALPAPIAGPTGGPGTYTEQNLAATLIGDAATYRIPALAHLGNGVVLAAWDGRPHNAADAPNPNSIVMRRSTDNGATWSETSFIAKGHLGTDGTQKYGYSDPSFVVDREAGKVFAFFVYSQNQGFHGSEYGNDIKDTEVIGAVVVESTDGGITWSEPRDITPVAKPGSSKTNPRAGDVKGTFASSGEGIQLRYGAHKGRLIQQFAGKVRQADGTELIQAYSVYSDDHGATWQRGGYVGTGMDENKTVELSDGRVMLNSRDSANSLLRKVTISEDGGETWGPVYLDTELPDPTNNGSITRMHPFAEQGSKDAQKLIFTNSNNGANHNRVNLTTRVSCDDGETWPGIRQFKGGFGAYSTATALADGKFGVLYEASYSTDIRFGSFDEEWLNVVCAPLHSDGAVVNAGASTAVPVTITNQEDTAITGTITLADTAGLTGTDTQEVTVEPGDTVSVNLNLAAATSARSGNIDAVFTATNGKQSRFTLPVTVEGTNAVFGAEIHSASAAVRDVTENPYKVGEKITYTFSVTNTSDETVAVVPTAGNFETGFLPPTAPNCRYRSLPAGASYTCSTAAHTVTQEDIDRGYFVPTMDFSVTSAKDPSRTVTINHTGAPVRVRDVSLEPSLTITGEPIAGVKDNYLAGDTITYKFTVTNNSPFTVSSVPTAGNFDAGFLPPAAPNCRYRVLDAGATYTCATAVHTITSEDLSRGYFEPTAEFTATSALEGSSKKFTHTGARIDLPIKAINPPVDNEPVQPVVPHDPFFTDVSPSHPFYDEVQWLAHRGITTGWEEADGTRTYRPAENIQRAAIAAYFYRLAAPHNYEAPAVSPFKDVPTTHPFYTEIAWMHDAGLSTGWADGTFRPAEPTSRAAMAAFFYRYDAVKDYTAPTTSPFKDLPTSHPFYTEISWLESQGITTGWADGTFRPAANIQRAPMAAFVYRYEHRS